MSNGYTGSDSANEAEAIHIADSIALQRALRTPNLNQTEDCLECGEEIPAARRALIPNVRCCVKCQSELDKIKPKYRLNNVYVP